MTRLISIASVAAMLLAGTAGVQAQQRDRDRDRDRDRPRMHQVCKTVTKCHREHGKRVCHKERECKMVPMSRR